MRVLCVISSTPTSPPALARLTPSETTRSASTSRPESVSSRIANLGARSSICRISWRFFSPPEKPSLTFRSANTGSIRRFSMAARTSLTQCRSGGAWPVIAVLAVRRKLDTLTPGTSTGYCMARNIPARARASTVIASTSAPSRVTEPEVIWYFGCPAREYARVDLPEPFGPMIACVSPLRTVRSTPRRICLGPSLVSTLTCRSRISRVDMRLSSEVQGRVDVDQHAVAVQGQGVHGNGPNGRQGQRGAGPQVERRAVQPALDGAAVDLPVGQRDLAVRADVGDRVQVTLVVADDGDLGRPGLARKLHAQRGAGGDVVGQAGQLCAHLAPSGAGSASVAARAGSSSPSIAAIRRFSTCDTPIWCTSSAKNPRTTSRRASSSGMPRGLRAEPRDRDGSDRGRRARLG